MFRPAHLIVSTLALLTIIAWNASAHHNSVTTKYYHLGTVTIEASDVQRVWRANLKTSAYDADMIELLALFNLLTPVFIDTDIQVSTWTAYDEPLYVADASAGMMPLNVLLLERTKGEQGEGDTPDPVIAYNTNISLTRKQLWFAIDTDGTLLVASDGAPVAFNVYGLH